MAMTKKLGGALVGAILVLGSALPLTAEAQWIFVAHRAMNRIQQVTQDQDSGQGQNAQTPQRVTQVATVILDVPAKRVYDVATNATSNNQNVTVVSNDPASMTIKVKEGDQSATLAVSALNKNVSQLMIVGSAPAGQNPQTSRIVNAAMNLCNDMGKKCELGTN
ncbi:MAG: hypothetical protein FGM35_08765 [Rhodocyclaceae bacterium]|jgi:hypothetical protein|nr:hypothetical protein [Rhodocyclaceae bacterium]